MNRGISLLLIALAGSLGGYGLVSMGGLSQRQSPPRLSIDDSEAIQVAATGLWRAFPRAVSSPETTEVAAPTEVVTVPPEKAVSFLTKGSPVSEMRGEIALDLQRELARVGCYAGEINGAWTLSTRQAMKIFMERVNATLPIHQPDAVLLALVQSQPGNVCGTSCPAGQSRARDGRCIPTALLSRDFRQEKQPVSANAGWSATTTVASERPPSLEDGQMALAGPKIDTPNSEPVRAEAPVLA